MPDRAEAQVYKDLLKIPSRDTRKAAILQRDIVRDYVDKSEKWWSDAFAASYKNLEEEIEYQIELGDQSGDENVKRRHYSSAVMKGRVAAKIFTKDGVGPGLIQAIGDTFSGAAQGIGDAARKLTETGSDWLKIAALLAGLYFLSQIREGK